MRHMYSLAVLLFPVTLWAAGGQIETRVVTTSTSGAAIVNLQNTAPNVGNLSSSVSLRSPGLLGNSLVLNANATNSKNDYSGVIITSSDGKKSPLSESFDRSESTLEAGAELKRANHTVTVSYGKTITDSPYAFHGYSLAYNKSFYTNATIAGADYYGSQQKSPLTFYDDPSDGFHSKSRPTFTTARRVVLWLEQTLSDKWKTQGRFLEGQRSDRPQHLGLEWRNSYAVHDRWFTRLDTGFLSEQRGQKLRNERGYFDVYWLEAQLAYEPIYDFLVTLSAGSTVEREEVPWDRDDQGHTRKNQFGLDTFGLRLNYKSNRWNAGLQALSGKSNTSYRSSTYSGNFIWEI